MAVNLPRLALFVGPAGIGKTRFLLENFSRLVQESGDPFLQDVLLILPTAEHRERMVDLMLRKEGSGFFGERVTTLSRLMREFLKAGDFSWATDVERRLLLTEILAEKGGAYFRDVAAFPGFLEKMSDFVGELKESLVSREDLRKGVVKLKQAFPDTAEKYETLFEIYETYEKRLAALGYRDVRDGLSLLKGISVPPRFRHLFLDGFFDFSPSQLEFLRWLSEHSEQITLTLTVDLSRKSEGLFEIPLQTLKELEALGFKAVPFEGETNERAISPELGHVEKNLFREDCERRTVPAGNPPLQIFEATGIRGEVEMIARELRRLVRTGDPAGRPYHYSDIAVILRRIGEYQEIIHTVFREFEIPVEIHERERLRDTALARTAASFFRVLLDDWKREDLFNFLKSSYVERNYAHVCSLEIHSLDLGIAGGKERWLGEIGDPLFEKIAGFQEKARKERPVAEWIGFTREFFRGFGLTRIPLETDEGSRRDFAILKRFESLLEEIRHAAHTRQNLKIRFEAFAREFLGLIEVDLFSLHDRDKNRVQVYDVSLARQKEYKVVFLAGLLEKFFPVEIREDPILSDRERRLLGLKEKLPRQALERYFFYLGLTRAREALVLSYPRFDLEGHEALPSFYVDEVRKLFSGEIPTRSYPVSQSLPRLEDAVEEREVEAHLIEGLFRRGGRGEKKERALTLGLYNRFLSQPSFQALFPRILFDPVALIRDEKIRAAFLPKGGVFNPTSFQTYGGCPYRYFASRVLGLEEMEEGIDAREVGTLLHKVLESYWRERVEGKKRELEKPGPAKAFVTEKLDALLKEKPLSGERKYRVELEIAEMKEWLSRMVEKEIEEGNPLQPLKPTYFEFQFGIKPNETDYLRLFDPHREDLKVRGKIDRIDVDPSGKYALVIDYKTGGSFKREDLEFGTALQLPLYLLAAQKLLKLKPLAGMIYQIREAESTGFYAREGLEELGISKRSQNVLPKEDFDRVIERTVRFAFQYADGITKAEIPVRPRDCDRHCPFSSVCRIEKWRLPFIYEEIREEDRQRGIV